MLDQNCCKELAVEARPEHLPIVDVGARSELLQRVDVETRPEMLSKYM